jgi:hypothetical protein
VRSEVLCVCNARSVTAGLKLSETPGGRLAAGLTEN